MQNIRENKTGEVLRTCRHKSFEWRICNFLSLLSAGEAVYPSPEFHFSDSCWCLNVYLNISGGKEESCIDISLERLHSGRNADISLTLGIKNADDIVELLKEDDIHLTCKEFKWYGLDGVLLRSELLARQSQLVPYGVLTVVCTMKSKTQYSVEVSLFGRLWNQSRRWKEILDNEESADVVLKLKDRDISRAAHSLVLQSRSAVFSRRLASDMKDNKTGVIELVDDDEDALDVVLSYLYTGEPLNLSPENACKVYKTAHKYELPELRKLCCLILEENLSVDTICEVLALSQMYKEEELMKRAKAYFAKNGKRIVKTEGWNTFKKDKVDMVPDLLEYVAVEMAT